MGIRPSELAYRKDCYDAGRNAFRVRGTPVQVERYLRNDCRLECMAAKVYIPVLNPHSIQDGSRVEVQMADAGYE